MIPWRLQNKVIFRLIGDRTIVFLQEVTVFLYLNEMRGRFVKIPTKA